MDLTQHGDRPVIGVEWSDAAPYCRLKGKRLPAEAEWEKSARGTDGRLYPWGNWVPNKDLANFALGARFSYSQVLMPAQSYEHAQSPYGLYHMAGNVWEWVQDWYAVNYYEVSPEQNPQGPEQGQFKVLRGGSWSDLPSTSSPMAVSGFYPRRAIVIRASVAPNPNRPMKAIPNVAQRPRLRCGHRLRPRWKIVLISRPGLSQHNKFYYALIKAAAHTVFQRGRRETRTS